MLEIALATRNAHKAEEIAAILAGLPVRLRTATELGAPEVDEPEPTLEGNARRKALAVHLATGLPAIGDDTGLEVDALGGEPGVRSARYAGPEADGRANSRKLLAALAGVPSARRSARFRCVMALARAGDGGAPAVETCEGRLEGSIAEAERGGHGFGYDPLFVVAGGSRTLAEMPPHEKNTISHRARALADLRPRVLALLRRT